jgi:hypothetical protein
MAPMWFVGAVIAFVAMVVATIGRRAPSGRLAGAKKGRRGATVADACISSSRAPDLAGSVCAHRGVLKPVEVLDAALGTDPGMAAAISGSGSGETRS